MVEQSNLSVAKNKGVNLGWTGGFGQVSVSEEGIDFEWEISDWWRCWHSLGHGLQIAASILESFELLAIQTTYIIGVPSAINDKNEMESNKIHRASKVHVDVLSSSVQIYKRTLDSSPWGAKQSIFARIARQTKMDASVWVGQQLSCIRSTARSVFVPCNQAWAIWIRSVLWVTIPAS
jgi:hypothetical protein